MHRFLGMALMLLVAAGLVEAQIVAPSTDMLGAHLNYGRGCSGCHIPHSGAAGNGNARGTDPDSGDSLLWGQDVSSLYGKTITTGGGSFVEVLPTSMSATTPDVKGMLTCLSCHDGNLSSSGMMKNKVYETLPPTYGRSNSIPTLLGTSGGESGNYLSDHPVGLSAKISCGGPMDWDCTVNDGVVSMKGANSSRFVTNYGFFVKPGKYNGAAVVVCTTCHDEHSMSVFTVTNGANSGLPPGTYATMFFLRGPYNPGDSNPGSNQTAQFCRQCHGGKSNEMNGGSAGTVF